MTDHPERGSLVTSLMRQPSKCPECKRWHMPQEPCAIPVNCFNCGAPAGLYWPDGGNELRECHSCMRERTE
jgi:hypothetical protein